MKRKNTKSKGDRYEHYVAWKMRLHGYYAVKVIGKSHDYGCDVIGKYWLFGTIVVQCKSYKGKVGVKAVQEVIAAQRYYNASKAAVATNSTFTKAAHELARACGVSLWERY